jgi:Ran GTPase-activating protein (RanGAP) involved in mRNA processing and transport
LKHEHINVDLFSRFKCGGNSYSREACEVIAEIIRTKADKEQPLEVDFSNMFVGRKLDQLPDSLSQLIDAIQGFNVTHLYMSDNAFGPNGVVKFNKQLATHFENLSHLHLLNCGLGPEGTEMVAEALIENGSIKLQSLYISRNRVEDKGAKALAKYFQTNDALQKLLIYQNGIKVAGFKALLPSLTPSAKSGSLAYLDINDNQTSNDPKVIAAISDLLASAINLRTLSISDSGIQEPRQQFELI